MQKLTADIKLTSAESPATCHQNHRVKFVINLMVNNGRSKQNLDVDIENQRNHHHPATLNLVIHSSAGFSDMV